MGFIRAQNSRNNQMKILFDSQIFDLQKYGGISRYFSELLKSFDEIEDIEYVLAVRNTNNLYLSNTNTSLKIDFEKKDISIDTILQKILHRSFHTLNRKSNKNLGKKEIKGKNFDIFHPTYYSTYLLKYLKNKPFVLTVHDMIHEIYPKTFSLRAIPMIYCKRKLIMKADKIIAVSENTKKDILHFYNIPEEKINVIYHGNSMHPIQKELENAPSIPSKYILFVGSRNNYKNFIFFINSINPLLTRDTDLCIIVAGGCRFSKYEMNTFKKLGMEKRVIQYSVNDDVLAYLYRNAICFVFPTLYEGFGIPILEAFACSCPAVISNTSSLPEIGGDAVVYFNPTDSKNMMESIEKVLVNNDLRNEMISKGLEQLKKFSWGKTARETFDLYKEVLNNKI